MDDNDNSNINDDDDQLNNNNNKNIQKFIYSIIKLRNYISSKKNNIRMKIYEKKKKERHKTLIKIILITMCLFESNI